MIDLNPSDEKLREMIAEKDAEIERLKTDRDNWKERAIENNWPFEWQVASELAAENKKLRKEIKDAGRYRKLRPLFHKSIIMANGRRWWDAHLCAMPGDETLDAVIDRIPEVQS